MSGASGAARKACTEEESVGVGGGFKGGDGER